MSKFSDSPAERKKCPVGTGVLDYFPDALIEIARVSWEGNEQHNPGQHLHWAREKSTDESDALIRHFLERGTRDSDGMRHSAKMAWRALAYLQKEIENDRSTNGMVERHTCFPGCIHDNVHVVSDIQDTTSSTTYTCVCGRVYDTTDDLIQCYFTNATPH